MTWGDVVAQLIAVALLLLGVTVLALIWAGNGEMK